MAEVGLARQGFLEVRTSENAPWVNIGGMQSFDQSDAVDEIDSSDWDTTGQKPYETDLAEVTADVAANTKLRDPGYLTIRDAYNNRQRLEYRFSQVRRPGSDYEMQVGACKVTAFNRSSSKGELAQVNFTLRCFNIQYTDQSTLTA